MFFGKTIISSAVLLVLTQAVAVAPLNGANNLAQKTAHKLKSVSKIEKASSKEFASDQKKMIKKIKKQFAKQLRKKSSKTVRKAKKAERAAKRKARHAVAKEVTEKMKQARKFTAKKDKKLERAAKRKARRAARAARRLARASHHKAKKHHKAEKVRRSLRSEDRSTADILRIRRKIWKNVRWVMKAAGGDKSDFKSEIDEAVKADHKSIARSQ